VKGATNSGRVHGWVVGAGDPVKIFSWEIRRIMQKNFLASNIAGAEAATR